MQNCLGLPDCVTNISTTCTCTIITTHKALQYNQCLSFIGTQRERERERERYICNLFNKKVTIRGTRELKTESEREGKKERDKEK